MANETNIGHLEEEARKRKERLKALREKQKGSDVPAKKEKLDLPNPELKLRNYNPIDDKLTDVKVEDAKPGNVESYIKEQVEAQTSLPTVSDEVDLLNLAPRKPDWDLKRDIKSKLERLDRRTKRAIAEMIRERLTKSAKSDDLSHVNEVPDAPEEGYESD